MKNISKNINFRGFAGIIALLTVSSLVLVLTFSISANIAAKKKISKNLSDSIRSYYLAESGIEDAVLRVLKDYNYTAVNTFTLDGASINQNITQNGGVITINSSSSYSSDVRKVRTALVVTTDNISFHYGVQVGEGGVEMDQNSKIIGNIYANGSVTGASGSRIAGDVWIANGANPGLDANWTEQNADFSFGYTAGAAIATVDSVGDIGEYASMALGADGFARISYYDAANKDLKFARCANDGCSAKNITAVDSEGDQGSAYSSIAIGSDNMPRISYYDATSKDLKFARCTNIDCTARVITAIDSAGDVGQFSALALGANDFAMISYYSVTDGDLKFVQCANADCTARSARAVDSAGDVGKYTSIKIGSDGFARISYNDFGNKNVKFARCANADCSTVNITAVDSEGDVGQYRVALALNSNNFGFISYYDNTANSLKIARCANEDCVSKVITAVDSSGDAGKYSSIILGADGFARVSYYDAGNGAVKFARCLNADCTAKNISSVDAQNDTGHYTSLALGAGGFGRISYRDNTADDLKFIKCADAECIPPQTRADAAQSFELVSSADIALRKVSLYLKKVGDPPDVTVRIVSAKSGHPDDNPSNVLASGTLFANLVTADYGWVDVNFIVNPMLSAGQIYWIMADASIDGNNYWVWGRDNTDDYDKGTGKFSSDWTGGSWSDAGGDLDFKVWVGGGNTSIDGVIVEGNASAHSITNTKICGDGYYQTIDSFSLNFLNSPSNPACPSPPSLTDGVAHSNSTDPSPLNMPISQGIVDQWKIDAASGGTISGNYDVSNDVSLGPKEITGDLAMTGNNKTLTIAGTVYAHGRIDIDNGSAIRCAVSYEADSCLVLADGDIHIANNGVFSGSGAAGSFLMMLTNLQCDGASAISPDGKACGHHNGAIDVHNQATGVIFYAPRGMINLHNGVNITEASAYKLRLDNTAEIRYDQGLINAAFSSGPGGGWAISGWNETQ